MSLKLNVKRVIDSFGIGSFLSVLELRRQLLPKREKK